MIYAFKSALLLLQLFFITLLEHMKTMILDKGFLDGTHVKVVGGYYDEMTHVISSLNELEIKVVQNNIIASICEILPS